MNNKCVMDKYSKIFNSRDGKKWCHKKRLILHFLVLFSEEEKNKVNPMIQTQEPGTYLHKLKTSVYLYPMHSTQPIQKALHT